MLCVLAGLCATVVVRVLLAKAGVDKEVPMPIVTYLAFTVAFSFATWILWLA